MSVDKFKGWFYTVEGEMKSCTRAELDEFVKNYPRRLSADGFMGHAAWYDFSVAPMWPYGLLVAIFNYEYEESGWRICTNADEVIASRIPSHWAVYDHGDWRRTVDGVIVPEDVYVETKADLAIDKVIGFEITDEDGNVILKDANPQPIQINLNSEDNE